MFALVLAMLLQMAPPAEPRCGYDRAAMLAMDWMTFDQGPDGWRRLEAIEGCDEAAADLIADYRSMHGLSDNTTLYVHEAYARAFAGQTSRALDLFELARKDVDPFGWNIYMDATVAFLRRDRAALLDARERLATLPIPPDLEMVDQQGNPVDPSVGWPSNLHVVDAFVRCFDHDIRAAYDNAC